MLRALKQQSVSFLTFPSNGEYVVSLVSVADYLPDKFSGYQYGGRPLGLTYVKYTNPSNGDAMEGAEGTAPVTQDQMM
jgi:hypothetical protein